MFVTLLRIHIRSKKIPRCSSPRSHLEKLRDPTLAQVYTVTVSIWFEVLDTLEDPGELWDTFKRETLKATEECLGERPWSRSGVALEETLRAIEESRAARLAGNHGRYRTLSHRTRAVLRRDKEGYVRALAQDVDGCFNANNLNLWPAYRDLKKLLSKSASQTSTIRTADWRIVADMDEVRLRWAEYFERLYVAEPPSRQLSLAGVQMLAADPPVDETPPSLSEVREAVNKLK